MSIDRRGFLSGLLGVLVAGLVVDPEKLLWTPGKKSVSIPKSVKLVNPVYQQFAIDIRLNPYTAMDPLFNDEVKKAISHIKNAVSADYRRIEPVKLRMINGVDFTGEQKVEGLGSVRIVRAYDMNWDRHIARVDFAFKGWKKDFES